MLLFIAFWIPPTAPAVHVAGFWQVLGKCWASARQVLPLAIVASRRPAGSVACGTVEDATGTARAGRARRPAGPLAPPASRVRHKGAGPPLWEPPTDRRPGTEPGPATRPPRPGEADILTPHHRRWLRRRLPLFLCPARRAGPTGPVPQRVGPAPGPPGAPRVPAYRVAWGNGVTSPGPCS